MKLSLDSIGYGGYFTAPGEQATLEHAMERAAKFGYDAVCIYAHRPIGFPMDLDADRRKRLKDLAQKLDLEFGGVVCCTNFVEGNHVLVYPREKEIMYARAAIDLAKDMGIQVVRLMAALYGYFQNPYAGQGYGNPAFESRSRRVSRNEDWLEAWHQVREALHEVALYAQDQGVTIALQTHPEITGNNKETLEMLEEVNVPSLKVGLDLPLLESPYKWEEVCPGSPNDPCQWEVFLQACKEIGYDGYLSAEQCSPIIIKGHKLGTLATIDQGYIDSRTYFRSVLEKLDCYTGHKA
jgi:sugar phosphate isomerase/epimerase